MATRLIRCVGFERESSMKDIIRNSLCLIALSALVAGCGGKPPTQIPPFDPNAVAIDLPRAIRLIPLDASKQTVRPFGERGYKLWICQTSVSVDFGAKAPPARVDRIRVIIQFPIGTNVGPEILNFTPESESGRSDSTETITTETEDSSGRSTAKGKASLTPSKTVVSVSAQARQDWAQNRQRRMIVVGPSISPVVVAGTQHQQSGVWWDFLKGRDTILAGQQKLSLALAWPKMLKPSVACVVIHVFADQNPDPVKIVTAELPVKMESASPVWTIAILLLVGTAATFIVVRVRNKKANQRLERTGVPPSAQP